MKKLILFVCILLSALACANRSEQSWHLGNYRDTCRDCTFDSGHLTCTCLVNNTGEERVSTRYGMPLCPSNIVNCNGKLTCGRCQ